MENILSTKKTPENEVNTNTNQADNVSEPNNTVDSAESKPQVQPITETPVQGENKAKDITQMKVEKNCSRGMGA